MNAIRRLLLVCLAFGLAAGAFAQSLGDVRARMADRLPAVVALLRKEAVGENNQGFLAVRGAVTEAERRTVEGENADRRDLYRLLAEKEALTAEEVGRAQARTIARISARGFWIEDEEGKWARKP